MDLILLALRVAGTLLSFAGAVVIAIPFISKKEEEELKQDVQTDTVRQALYGMPDPDDWVDHPVWKTFLAQKKYTHRGLIILGAGIAIQVASLFW